MATAASVGNQIVILEPNGRLTAETVDEFTQTVARWLGPGRRDVILDLGSVTYLDSAGIGALAQAYVRSQRDGGRLVFAHVVGKNRELLRITKLLTIFEVYPSTLAAQSSLTGQRGASPA
jgi:anti-sigma B factor antagonist